MIFFNKKYKTLRRDILMFILFSLIFINGIINFKKYTREDRFIEVQAEVIDVENNRRDVSLDNDFKRNIANLIFNRKKKKYRYTLGYEINGEKKEQTHVSSTK
jgi:hypothetical protein